MITFASMDLTPVTLEGPTVQLTPLADSDTEEIIEAALSAPEVWRFMPMAMKTREDGLALVEYVRALHRTRTGIAFVTRERAGGGLLGSTSFLAADPYNRRIEIGATWLLPVHQRTRVNTEAKWLQLRHAFERMGCARVEFKTDARNAKSRAALARLGAVEEGTMRSHMTLPDGARRDSVYFSVVCEEWPVLKARLEARLGLGS